MPSIFQHFPSKYLKAADLDGRDVTLTIGSISVEQMEENGSETKPVVNFSDHPNQGLVLNKTNATTIADLHGEDTDHWAGKQITLFPTTCESFGKMVACIRIRSTPPHPGMQPHAPQQQPQQPPPQYGQWVPPGTQQLPPGYAQMQHQPTHLPPGWPPHNSNGGTT
jgi:hypothetical protein